MKYKFNNFINSKIIKLIDFNSNYLGIFKLKDSINKAKSLNLDLVEISLKNYISICKTINYNKFIYLKNKKNKNNIRNKNFLKKLKEVKFRLFIFDNDYKNKFRFIKKFLTNGFRLKITLIIKGREITKKSIIKKRIDEILSDSSIYGTLINKPNISDNIIFLYFNPFKINNIIN